MEVAKILVVEDETIVALDIKHILERQGWTVPAMFPSGEQALDSIGELQPDLVLLDIKLQGELDGVETSRLIQERFRLPVILITAFDDEETLQRAKVTQPFAYIVKPFEDRELKTAIVLSLYRHQIEQQVAERERLFFTTLRSIGDAVIVTDAEDRIEFMNPIAVRLLGQSEGAVRGRRFDEACTFEEAEVSAGSKIPAGSDRRDLLLPDGRRVPIELRSSPMIDEVGGEERGTVYVLHDIAERLEWERALEESQDQLRQAQKMEAIGRLSGGIAHDFNNLLTVIMGYTRLLGQGLEGLEADRRAPLLADLEGVNKAAHRSIALTRQLLAFSRQQVLSPKIVDINRIVADLEKMLRRLLSENIGLNITRRARDAYVYVDEGQMEQVLMNLVVNARDAMETTGIIAIRTGTLYLEDSVPTQSGEAPAGAYVVVSVEDTGSGISEKTLEHIFDPFFTTKERGQGTGLGLSTVYGIVQQSGGYISVETEERRGTTFRIMLPRVSSERTERSEDQPARSALEGSETLLLVEDDPSIRTLLTRVLSDRGYRVVQAQNAGEAVLICENENLNIDLLISDIIMPHVTGLDLAKRMRKTRPELRVLLISGYPEEISESMSTETDFSYLQKPFDPETLLAKARKILDS